MAKKNKEEIPEEEKELPVWKLILASVVGLVLIVWGSDVTVDAATAIAQYAGLSERFIGLTIVALGTSLPELFTSVSAAMKGKADIAIGNIVGSNIFNILFVVGTAALITPVVVCAKLCDRYTRCDCCWRAAVSLRGTRAEADESGRNRNAFGLCGIFCLSASVKMKKGWQNA